jgi:hypothetical protein
VCAALPRDALLPLLAQFDGMRFGPSEMPDIVRFRIGDWDVDLFVAKDEDDLACLARARPIEIGGATARVVTPEDLFVHKLRKLRSDRRRILQDVADLRALIGRRNLDWSFIEARALPDEHPLLDALRHATDEELLAHLTSGTWSPSRRTSG